MSHPRLKLAAALALSVAIGGKIDESLIRGEGVGVAVAGVLAALALWRWLPAIVSLRSPGRRLIVFLVTDFLVAGFLASMFAAYSRTSSSFAAAAIGVVAAGVAVFWWLPQWQATRWPSTITGRDRVELEDKARATIAQLLGGLGLIATVAITLYSVNQARVAADRTLRTTERDQAAARASRAIEQLAAESGSRPAKGPAPATPRDCNLRWDVSVDKGRPAHVAADVAAALDVLRRLYTWGEGRRENELDPFAYLPPLDLSRSDLRGADLSSFDLNSASFTDSTLAGADLSGSSLGDAQYAPDGVLLDGVDLRNACLAGADGLDEARTAHANVDGAVICDKHDRPIRRWVKRGAICPSE